MKAFLILACEQALRGTLAAGREREGEFATTSLEFEFHPPPIRPIPLWLPVDSAVRPPPISAKRKLARMWINIKKHLPRVLTSLLISSLPISISHRLFRCRYSDCRDLVASSPSFPSPAARAPRRACSQASLISDENLVLFYMVFP